MIGLLVVLIIASPFVYWHFRRRAGARAGAQGLERNPSVDNIAGAETEAGILEAECASDRPNLVQGQVESDEDLKGALDPEQRDLLDLDTAPQFQQQRDKSTQQDIESHLPANRCGEVLPSDLAGSAELLPPAQLDESISIPVSEIVRDSEKPANGPEMLDLVVSGLAEEPVVDAVTATTIQDEYREADHAVPTAEIAEAAPVLAEELSPINGDAVNAQLSGFEPLDDGTRKTPPRYRPPVQRPPRQVTARPVDRETVREAVSGAVREIRIRLTFDRFGFCAITFLPGRTTELDDEVAVKLGGASLHLVAQEDWYQDLAFDDASGYLRQGFELKGLLSDQRRVRWLLKGRDVYVLAAHPRASGFVSAARLALGRSHVVLCIAELFDEVEAVLKEAGCEGYTKLDETLGLPPGWAGFRSVMPVKAIALDLGTSDTFFAIKPAADIEIEFEGGVRLRNSVWLAGYPPHIKLFGQTNAAMKVLIDGKEAHGTSEGSLIADGYSAPGQHSVYCEGLSRSRSYSIEEPPDSWEAWPAYQFGQAGICGPLVQLPHEAAARQAFAVPMSNPLLIGAEPGQIFRCSSRGVAVWKGFVPFDVVWALPAQPLICNKKTSRILQFADKPPMPRNTTTRPLAWCIAILDASRKGLRIENSSTGSIARWSEYKKTARSIWRGRR